MGKSFKSSYTGWGKVLRSAGVQGSTDRSAELVAARARAAARVKTGEYRDSIHVVSAPTGQRARSEVRADAPHASIVEARDNTLGGAL